MTATRPPLLTIALVAVALAAVALATPPLSAQQVSATDSVLVVPNPEFRASSFFRAVWGGAHRAAWTAELRVPILDLANYSGGLEPVRVDTGGTHSALLFRDGDGREFRFRSVSRDLSINVPVEFKNTFIELIVQEEVAAQYPVAPLVVDPLQSATGVLEATSKLVSLPDDERLGEFRKEFGNMLGILSRVAGPSPEGSLDTEDVIDSGTLFDLVRLGPSNRVDAYRFLKARLLDIYIGDIARRPRHWRWVLPHSDPTGGWKPVPEDRDAAFSRLDGFIPSRLWMAVPELVGYGRKYKHLTGVTLSASALDRDFLTELEWSAWDSIAGSFVSEVSDSVITSAIQELPEALQQIDSTWFRSTLEARRGALREAAYEYYRILAGTVEIRGTDAAETARITQLGDGAVEVRVSERGRETEPYFQRRFLPDETRELRIRLRGGGDRFVVDGTDDLDIKVRLLAGRGSDTVDFVRPVAGVRLYDQFDGLAVIGDPGRHGTVDRRRYEEWTYSYDNEIPPRTWGTWTVPRGEIGVSGDYGLFLGAGARRFWYGFRRDPYAARVTVLAGASTQGKLEFSGSGDFRQQNSPNHLEWRAIASSRKVLHWFGLGNDTPDFANQDSSRVDRWLIAADVAVARVFLKKLDLLFGPTFSYSLTGANEGHYIATQPNLYGNDDFAELGAFAELRFDNRNNPWAATRGFRTRLRGAVYPALFSVASTFSMLDLVAATYITPSAFDRATIALRAGGKMLFGQFPWFESAFIGGVESVRGYSNQRFAGDASLYGSAEVRAFLFDMPRILPGRFGGTMFVDTGRVFVDEESPGGFHTGVGVGVWFQMAGQSRGTFTANVAFSDEGGVVYVAHGFQF